MLVVLVIVCEELVKYKMENLSVGKLTFRCLKKLGITIISASIVQCRWYSTIMVCV